MKIAAVIPCFKCKKHISDVVSRIGPEVTNIYIVDDACPEGTGKFIKETSNDPRLVIVFLTKNQGVGGAVVAGYRKAIEDGMSIIVKIDGDGQMDPRLINTFIRPLIAGYADYVKGNRFSRLEDIKEMPKIRIIGNLGLSFISKLSTGYWQLLDPTNGYTAIHAKTLAQIDFEKLSKRYFFESDMLFRLGLLKAVVLDVPMASKYADEVSNLKVSKVFFEFAMKHAKNTFKRIFYQYFLIDFNFASLTLVVGWWLCVFGLGYGAIAWIHSYLNQTATASGTVMLAALPIILGVQCLLSFFNFDMSKNPKDPLFKIL